MDRELTFSAPGRVEISGNHTDHQWGCVLTAAIDLNTQACVRPNGEGIIRLNSQGFAPVQVRLDELVPREAEKNTTAAIVRGMAAAFAQRGVTLTGFDADVTSTVLPGSGLSSSAAFEVMMGRIFNGLCCQNTVSPVEIAKMGQWVENTYFDKPCGLMDQMASSVGGLVYIDFADPADPVVERVDYDFSACGYVMCVIDSGADHADLTAEYAAIPQELAQVCRLFGCQTLRQVPETDFYARLPQVRQAAGDRAALRAMHVYEENRRVAAQMAALKMGDFPEFLRLVEQSGQSSWMYLQNVIPQGNVLGQQMAMTIALGRTLLAGRGAVRVHGGGFAGTALAFVPADQWSRFRDGMEAVLGHGACHPLTIQ